MLVDLVWRPDVFRVFVLAGTARGRRRSPVRRGTVVCRGVVARRRLTIIVFAAPHQRFVLLRAVLPRPARTAEVAKACRFTAKVGTLLQVAY